jgi:hypothetical protein
MAQQTFVAFSSADPIVADTIVEAAKQFRTPTPNTSRGIATTSLDNLSIDPYSLGLRVPTRSSLISQNQITM